MSYRDLLALCREQEGMFTSAQAHKAGVDYVQLHRMVQRGELTRLRRGVYRHEAVFFPGNEELVAAWMSLYPEMSQFQRLQNPHLGTLRTESAALIHGIGNLRQSVFTFASSERKQTRSADIAMTQAQLRPDEITLVQGLPVTTPTRTVVDLLDEMNEPEHIAQVIEDALFLQLPLEQESINEALHRYARRSGYSLEHLQQIVLEAFSCAPQSLVGA